MRAAIVVLVCFVVGFLFLSAHATGQAAPTEASPTQTQPNRSEPHAPGTPITSSTSPGINNGTPTFPRERHFLSDREFWLSLEVLLFGGGVIFIEFLLLRQRPLSAEEALRVYAITLIIVGALFTVTAGFDNISVAPAFGLLGTVAGYLLGRRPVSDHDKTHLAQEKENA